MSCEINNLKYTSIFSNTLIQITIIFAFLTLFFFSYVSKVENEEFKNQIDFVVDSIYKRYSQEINNLVNSNGINKNYIKAEIYGLIDLDEDKINKTSKTENQDIKNNNKKILDNALFYVITTAIVCFIVLSLIFIISYNIYGCYLPIGEFLKEGFILLIFIFIIEFLFLNIIVKNYITSNPNIIKTKITSAIIKYIDERDKSI
jgi:hypothetical protein